ncbi:hypothetical protein LJR219_000728 [Phenylobacterium sp. LjRoot219]|uniref:hypothetical protein n=1 Tax=Phenylobacterium sp. LjRoot219 TaxID=3342283 RepID=UPI003ECC51FD
MAQTHSGGRAPLRQALAGAALFLVGALTIAVLIYISNSQEPGAVQAMMDLGLAGTALISAIAQGLVFWGGWLIWRATRRRAG